MATEVKQATPASPAGNQLTLTYTGGTTAGNQGVLVFLAASGTVTVSSIADTQGNTWTATRAVVRNTTLGQSAWIYHCTSMAGGGANNVVTITYSASVANATSGKGWELSGLDASAMGSASTNGASGNSASPNGGNVTLSNGGFACAIGAIGASSAGLTLGSGWSDLATLDFSLFEAAEERYPTAGTYALDFGNDTSGQWVVAGAAFEDPPAATLDQEGFRFGNDDGNEAGYTFAAAQDSNVSAAIGTNLLLRCLIDVASGDPLATAYTLRSQKNGAGGYVAVPVAANTTPTLTFGAAGTTGFSTSGGTSVDAAYPSGITSNSALVLIVGQKPSSANGGTVTTPTGWTLQASKTGANDGDTGGYTTTLGADTGNTNIYVYTKDTVDGTETGNLTITVGTNNVCWANMCRVQAAERGTWSYAATVGKDIAGGNVSITGDAGIAIAAGDHVIFGMVIPTDVTTPAQFSAEAVTQSGTTFGTANEYIEPDSNIGNDIGGWAAEAAVTAGSGSAAPVWTATAGGTTTNVRGPGFIIRLRCSSVANEVYVSPSSNIAAGGEATTARLTAPSGKTTSDFVTGRRWDNENGTDTIDITTLDYTEVEWCLNSQSPAVATDFFDFRVYAGSTALTTYTVTPRWTLTSGGATTVSAAWSGVAAAVLALAGYQFGAGVLSVVTAASLTGAGQAALSWQVPTTASAGTAVHIIVFSGNSPTYAILAQGTATVASNGIATIPSTGIPGDKAFALVHNWDDDENTTSIFAGGGIATVS